MLKIQKKINIKENDKEQKIMEFHHPNTKKYNNGSIWPGEESYYSILFLDRKARRVGDIVTIIISEISNASKNADTKAEKKSNLSAKISSFFGSPYCFVTSGDKFTPKMEAENQTTYEGKAETSRSGTLKAKLTAKIIEVLPNGNYRIEGRREITVNNEKQFLILSGIIRPQDISQNNIVYSSNIADAKITYTGQGILSEKQMVSWGTRIMDYLWPF